MKHNSSSGDNPGQFLEKEEQKNFAVGPDEYQAVFQTKVGRKVLADILRELYFFYPAKTDEERVLNNYAKRLLENLNVYVEGNSDDITRKLMEALHG